MKILACYKYLHSNPNPLNLPGDAVIVHDRELALAYALVEKFDLIVMTTDKMPGRSPLLFLEALAINATPKTIIVDSGDGQGSRAGSRFRRYAAMLGGQVVESFKIQSE